jgi:hypothetical protein
VFCSVFCIVSKLVPRCTSFLVSIYLVFISESSTVKNLLPGPYRFSLSVSSSRLQRRRTVALSVHLVHCVCLTPGRCHPTGRCAYRPSVTS